MARSAEYREFTINLWLTDLNSVEIGIYKHSRHMAKSRQFTKDMDVIGEVIEGGERVGLLAYRKGIWKKNSGMERRLVIKLFSASMNWKGTLDLMMGRSLQLTHGAGGFPVTAFSINLANHQQMINLERSAYKWIGFPEKFSFFVLRDDKPYFYRIRRDWISIGGDYSVFDQNNRKIGWLDGKVIDLGGKWKVKILEEHSGNQLNGILQLFCAMLKYNDSCREHISSLAKDMKSGHLSPELEPHESDLYQNPRRVR